MDSTIACNYSGDPEISSRHGNGKFRALVGWNHQNDTDDGLKTGKIWCWVSAPPAKFQVYDSEFNRPTRPGKRRDCGPANFSMVRMFHPYWAIDGAAPQDMVSSDKQECRDKYHQLIREFCLEHDLPYDETPEEYEARLEAENTAQKEQQADASLPLDLAQIGGNCNAGPSSMTSDTFPATVEADECSSENNALFFPEELEEEDQKPQWSSLGPVVHYIDEQPVGAGTRNDPIAIG